MISELIKTFKEMTLDYLIAFIGMTAVYAIIILAVLFFNIGISFKLLLIGLITAFFTISLSVTVNAYLVDNRQKRKY